MAARRAVPFDRHTDSDRTPASIASDDTGSPIHMTRGQTARLHTQHQQQEQQQQKQLALILFTAWLLPILLGVFLFEEVQSHKELEEDKVSLPLGWFDWLLRNLGTLLPIPAILLRISGSLASLLPTNPAGKLELAAYLAASALRLVVYQLHVSGLFGWLSRRGALPAVPVQYMSDHIFLSGCITAILATEIVIGVQQIQRSSQPRLLPAAGVACSIILYLLASGDMFYTARYFHPQFESLLAAACTAAFFKYPLFLFCSWTGLTGKLAE